MSPFSVFDGDADLLLTTTLSRCAPCAHPAWKGIHSTSADTAAVATTGPVTEPTAPPTNPARPLADPLPLGLGSFGVSVVPWPSTLIVASAASLRAVMPFRVPLLLRLGNSGKAAASLYAVAGPTFGILVRNQGVADQLKNTDVGVVVGAGVTLSRLLLEGRYTAGLTDFNKGGTVYKNRVLSLLVGLNF